MLYYAVYIIIMLKLVFVFIKATKPMKRCIKEKKNLNKENEYKRYKKKKKNNKN